MTWIFAGWMFSRFFMFDMAMDSVAGSWSVEGGSGQRPAMTMEGGSGQPPAMTMEGGSGQPPAMTMEGGSGQPPRLL